VVEDNETGRQRRLDARALFVFIGAEPYTSWLAGQVARDDRGFVCTGADAMAAAGTPDGSAESDMDGDRYVLETSRAGVFAVGDVRSRSIKRVASAVGEGSMAVRLVHERLAGTAGQADR
jgi:thioredoxin reductase (NADPH)